MTVSSEQSYIEYNGDGATQTFTIPFYFILNSDISVTVSDASGNLDELTYGVDFSATGGGNQDGGSVTLNTAYPTGYTILVYRNPPETQETVYYENGKFPAKSHEKALDKLTMLIQKFSWWLDSLALKKPSYIAQYYDASSNRISNLADPVNTQDASTKNYTDTADGKAIRFANDQIQALPPLSQMEGKLVAISGGRPVGVLPASGSASDVMTEFAKPTGAGLSGFSQGTTYSAGTVGYELTQIDKKLANIVNVQSYYSGSGYYNSAVLAAAAAGTEVFLGGDVTLDPSILLDLSAFPNRRYYGGRFINGQILVRGTLGTSISLTSAITEGQKNFTQANSFAVGDLLLIQNFPTNANDAYTSGTPSLFMGGTRTYTVSGSTTLRDTRRKQLFDVSVASSSAFSTYQEAADGMSTSSLTATKVNAVKGITFDCNFKGGTLWCELTDGLKVTGRFENTFLNNVTCIRSNIRPVEFFSTTDARIDFFESCTGFKINTITSGHTSTGDNAIIKILGCQTFDIDAVITGTNVNTGYAHGVMIDTIFEENPSGYPAIPSRDYTVRVDVSSIRSTVNGSHAVSIVSDPYRAKNKYGMVSVNSRNGTVHLKGCDEIVVQGVVSIISLEGARYCDLTDLRRDSDYLANWTSVYGSVTNINHLGVNYSDTTGTTVTGETTAGTVTISARQCTFVRKGREVKFNLIIAYTALTGTGNLVVTIPTLWSCKSGIIHNFSAQVSGQNNIFAQMVDGTRSIRFQRNDTTYVQATDVTAGTIRISGTYIADYTVL